MVPSGTVTCHAPDSDCPVPSRLTWVGSLLVAVQPAGRFSASLTSTIGLRPLLAKLAVTGKLSPGATSGNCALAVGVMLAGDSVVEGCVSPMAVARETRNSTTLWPGTVAEIAPAVSVVECCHRSRSAYAPAVGRPACRAVVEICCGAAPRLNSATA